MALTAAAPALCFAALAVAAGGLGIAVFCPGERRSGAAVFAAGCARGALAAPVGEAGEGWQKIALPDGREGYTKCSLWEDDYKTPPAVSEEALRARAVEVALSYQGTQYRWGGKSPLGVDCSGLTFMAWFFCGVSLYRDARLVDGFPARPIPFEARKPGDLLYFPGHIALYLGNDRYIHSTARAGSDGVVINSLDPAAPDYRADLREKLYAVGSVFPLA